MNMNDLIAQHAQQHQHVIGQLNDLLQAGISTVQAGVDANQQLNPMRQANTAASWDAPIHYPQGVVQGPQFLLVQIELIMLNAANAQVISQGLGLPIVACRQQIMDYLGCGITL
ncbi:hypothetical protein EDB85DRAFT_1898645 [Lactarius pseudohatsudake]|nr:hypothetical protein EDB85DRAFT_1898645 [Lactarius pseudohatsudake]